MRRRSLAFAGLIIALAVALMVRSYLAERRLAVLSGGGPEMLAGSPARDFQVDRLGGGRTSLASYRGKIVLANLWATWCAPCRTETPALQRLARTERARGLVVAGINQGESADVVGAFVRRMHLDYPILLDTDQRYGNAYAAIGLPTTIVIGRDGKIVRGVNGEMTYAQMRALVEPLAAMP